MEAITNMLQVNFYSTAVSILTLLAGYKATVGLLEFFAKTTGIEFKWMRKKREDHELLINTAKGLRELEEQRKIDVAQSIKHDTAIRGDLAELKALFIDREIDSMRWDIINFSSIVADGKPCNKDSYKHCFRTYEKYEKLLKDNDMTNGEVDISMDIVNESYKEKLKSGF